MADQLDRIAQMIGGSRVAAMDWLHSRDLEEANRRRKAGNNVSTDATTILKSANRQAANLYSAYRSKINDIRADHRLPEAGKFKELAMARDKAIDDLNKLRDKVETAEHVARAKAAIRR